MVVMPIASRTLLNRSRGERSASGLSPWVSSMTERITRATAQAANRIASATYSAT